MHTPEQFAQRAKINRLLYEGTQEEWVQSIRDYANLPDAPRQSRRRPVETPESISEPTPQPRILKAGRPIKHESDAARRRAKAEYQQTFRLKHKRMPAIGSV
jgi:hypothetical protein